jgi:Uri superfamily endonuclease
MAVTALPREGGVYVLELDLTEEITVRAGRLGLVRLGPGRLRYYGSARGPGGLKARVQRHLRVEGRRPHWHIDAVTAVVPVTRVMIAGGGSECDLVRRDLASGRWVVAAPGFGSSDCRRCPAHLLAEVTRGSS